MEGSASSRQVGAWTEYISDGWFREHLASKQGNHTHEDFTFVDIGGGHGHELRAFMRRFPDLRGRFILQDLSVQGADSSQAHGDDLVSHESRQYCREGRTIEKMPHDFFDTQPIKGADIYLLARILHDWPDEQAKAILASTRVSMKKTSTLFIFDRVFSDRMEKVSHTDALYDGIMMALFSALERSESQFKSLLEGSGLRLVKVWWLAMDEVDRQAVLEVDLAD